MINKDINDKIVIKTTVNASVEKVWQYWTEANHIIKWSYASDDWYCPSAENDLRVGGEFRSRMEAKDGSLGFDFGGVYDYIRLYETICYTIGDGRKVEINFINEGTETEIIETFEAEITNPIELQQQGWQVILDNFKKYVENTK